jgi:hypothetical protein
MMVLCAFVGFFVGGFVVWALHLVRDSKPSEIVLDHIQSYEELRETLQKERKACRCDAIIRANPAWKNYLDQLSKPK